MKRYFMCLEGMKGHVMYEETFYVVGGYEGTCYV